ncbi:hypothetical protein D3C83_181440 [compost metagenome]
MQSRTYAQIEPFDEAVTQLRDYVDRLLADGTKWGAEPARQARDDLPKSPATMDDPLAGRG